MRKELCLLLTFWCSIVLAVPPKLPAGMPPGQYDEEKVPQFTLPDPLILLNGVKVNDVNTWVEKRRPEVLKLFETHVYGRTMVGRPHDMTWRTWAQDENALNGSAITKNLTIYFVGKRDGPKMDINIFLPADATKRPAPVFLIPGWGPNPQVLLRCGYGLVTFNPWQIEPDKRDGYANSIRKFFAKSDQNAPGRNEWGAIGAWAWAMSRAMDYIVTDADIDANKVCVMGFSRYGKVAMWAGAQDERFAIVFSGQSGCGGQTLVRRGFGETVKSMNGYAPHWFCRNFKDYNNRVNDLPVDWHLLIALMAPRPVYIAVAEQDYWGDPRGSFLAAKYAEPVYKLFAKPGLSDFAIATSDREVIDMPPVETPVGDFIGFHSRKGGHSITNYDWEQFLSFADRHFSRLKGRK